MTMNPLPPQAYTTETVTKAYTWLQRQPSHIKDLATNTEILVSLYLKAKMNGEAALDRPSIQNFKSELKNLAGMMGEFENSPPAFPSHAGTPPQFAQTTSPRGASASPHSNIETPYQSVSTGPTPNYSASYSNSSSAGAMGLNSPSSDSSSQQLDSRSLETLREVRALLNLSSEQEALRVLIQVGGMTLTKISK